MELTRDNRRLADRRPLPKEAAAVLMVGGQPFNGRLKDYSPKGFGMVVGEGAVERLKWETAEVRLQFGDRTFAGVVKHTREDGFQGFVGIRTADSAGQEISFTNDDPGWDLIEDAETIRTLFDDLAFKGAEAMIEVRQLSGRAQAFATKVTDSAIEMEVHATERGEITGKTASFRFELFQTAHAFEGKVERITDRSFAVALPKQVARLLRRETVRVPNGTNDVTLKVELSSRLLGEAPQGIRLVDFSEHGISVVDAEGWAHAPIGTEIEKIRILTPEGLEIAGHGTIRGHRWDKDTNAFVAGIQFETSLPKDRTVWHNVILRGRYPFLDFRYTSADHGKIWGLFERSGYVGHLDQSSAGDQLNEPRQASHITWKLLNDSGTINSRRLMYRTPDDIIGHLQMDRYYTNTWCVHHLAIDKVVTKVLAKDLYGAVTDILSTEEAQYLISYHRPDLAWNQRNYYQFVEKYPFPSHHHIQPFSLFDVDLRRFEAPAGHEDTVQIRLADRWDLRRIHRFFELNYPPLVREAMSVTEKDLLLEDLNGRIAPFGLERGRQFIVAANGQELLGFAQVEWGTTGVNVFRLFDAIFIHLAKPVPDIVPRLIRMAAQVMEKHGKSRALLFLSKEQIPEEVPAGLQYLCDEVRWIANCAATRRYQAYTQMMFGHLLLRRDKIRQKHATKDE